MSTIDKQVKTTYRHEGHRAVVESNGDIYLDIYASGRNAGLFEIGLSGLKELHELIVDVLKDVSPAPAPDDGPPRVGDLVEDSTLPDEAGKPRQCVVTRIEKSDFYDDEHRIRVWGLWFGGSGPGNECHASAANVRVLKRAVPNA